MSFASSSPQKPESSPAVPPRTGADAPSKVPFKDSVWRPVASCGGALAVGLLLSPFFIKPHKTEVSKNELPELILPRETTMIVVPSPPPGALLLGQVKLVADVTGKATVGGAVARQVVEPGAHVKKGDTVVEISSGQSERPAPAAESLQNQAEKSQIEASNAQNVVAQKIDIAQTKLRIAQERVDSAQAQVGTARDIVRRLQNGEAVSSDEIPAPFRKGARTAERPAKKRVANAPTPVPNRAGEIALQQAEAAREAAKAGATDLKTARQMLNEARDSASAAAERLKTATKNVADIEAKFDDKKATGADVELARSDQRNAQTAVTSTAKAVTSATAEVAKREKAASTLQSYADKAASDAKAAMKDVKLFPTAAPTEAPAPVSNEKPTLDQAIQFATAALEESRSASREAERLHNEIDGYQRQVKNSTARVESASENLASAQQKVLDSVPRVRFTSVPSPADGIITWISSLAREVKSGQSVFGIARGDKVAARFEDKGNLWRGLKPGTVLSAIASADSSDSSDSDSGDKAKPTEVPAAAPTLIQVKVTEVEEPSSAGEAAVVTGEVTPLTSTPSATPLNAGMTILASVAKPGEKPVLSVPASALVKAGTADYVAILTPATENGDKAHFHLVWKSIKTGRGDSMRREVLSGLEAGSRIVAQPENLQQMGFAPQAASDVARAGTALPQEVSSNDVLVRLTPASA